MNQPNNLKLEQQFQLTVIKQKITSLSQYESKKYLYLTLEYMLIKDNIIKFLVKNQKL
uniref:Phycobilisome degradation protein n=1 Tax=Nemalion vermiculare TaxID=935621 RepID=UPI002580E05E|nr:Phycobilisome degradation protein [Nemalion vermiculare]WGV34477.1 Phycobilisome degradation protein [Nemalion vermiculare]